MSFDAPSPQGRRPEPSRRTEGYAPRRPAPPKGTYVIGFHPVMEALEAGKDFQRVLIQRDEKGERTGEMMQAFESTWHPCSTCAA